MLSTVSMLLAFGLFSTIGFLYADKLKTRQKALEELLDCLRQMELLMRYSQDPLKVLLKRVASRAESLWFETFSSLVTEGKSPLEAARQTLEELKLTPRYGQLKKQETDILLSFASGLGSLDTKAEQKRILLAVEELTRVLEEARRQNETRGKLYKTLGLLTGLAGAILLA